MSRPIKFRAWDRPLRNMIDWEDMGRYEGINGAISDGSFILMQYTGLKDKNGIEIYEGDIVQGRNHKDEPGEPREVKWSNNGYHADNLVLWSVNKCEVIGNIYENKELANEN